MKRIKLLFTLLLTVILLVSCGETEKTQTESSSESIQESKSEGESEEEMQSQKSEVEVSSVKAVYVNITAQEAKEIMDSQTDYVILDVRTEEEFNEKHIPGAILIPDYEIEEKAEEILTDKDKLLLVYCRSGRRSKNASEILVRLGYTNIKEFGGIIDWPYETVSGS
ncbi:MAG: rhodanese-like domain-containing protein [Clostridia bacterium]|nr:rhodanese-like domain-containing protein [Clostridia bacterium]